MPQYIKVFENVLDEDFCQRMVQAFSEDAAVEDDPQPSYSRRRYLFLSDKAHWSEFTRKLEETSNLLVEKYGESLSFQGQSMLTDWFDDGFVMAHYRKGDVCAFHDDGQTTEEPCNGLRLLTVLFYLNDAAQGETHFPIQNTKIEPRRGRAIVFPAMLTHPHEVLAAGSDRYIAQTWIIDPSKVVNERQDW